MITREQAEQIFHEYISKENPDQIRNVEIEEIASSQVDLCEDDGGYDAQGAFELEERAWKCTFEYKWSYFDHFHGGQRLEGWQKRTRYIVEAKPGPYLIE